MLISEIDRIINEVNGSMTIEGMPLTNEDVIFFGADEKLRHTKPCFSTVLSAVYVINKRFCRTTFQRKLLRRLWHIFEIMRVGVAENFHIL